ncbi:uncharacterized protein PGTG_18165 [Puccinia graminis f. sp. tritici CRL 75-36-700-3]|uniref:Uncharacterized protein n=1 Tax=Puccinia graminis f. sp. tritici (strain CRL 75-36-700-3 / race SCCL) TaxID=418459 RepID=E3L6A0_PUCGT|nr:uncharacterized protein PGTG_18165 [Puccinia graminis f. sp. tritici CRL 75-36-700-3]EFP92075.2 hypothetical protein PGTG_18165 [Puccinia graminis f. sp. tritici CRL 75-36-700-3]
MSEALMNQLMSVSAGESQILDGEAKDIETYGKAGQAEPSKKEIKTPNHSTYLTWKTCSKARTTGKLLPNDDDQADLKRSMLKYEQHGNAAPCFL